MGKKLSNLFAKDIERLRNPLFRNKVSELVEAVSDVICTAPSSSTGKYHPNDELGEDGMFLHIKRCLALVDQACQKYNFLSYEKDVLMAGCILHDVFKFGIEGGFDNPNNFTDVGTVYGHPQYIHDSIGEVIAYYTSMTILFPDEREVLAMLKDLQTACAWHEGRWTTVTARMEKPTRIAKAMHEIDYWASRREIYDIMRPEWSEKTKKEYNDNI